MVTSSTRRAASSASIACGQVQMLMLMPLSWADPSISALYLFTQVATMSARTR
jgi:hypothetical protein